MERTNQAVFLPMTISKWKGSLWKKNKSYYQTLFQEYPDVVTQEQLRMMLNGVSISFTSKLIHEKRVKVILYKACLLYF